MQRARKLLRTTRLGIEQIAQAVGYSSGVTFDRIFKRAYGITPSEFRASRRHLRARDRRDRGSPKG
jgi:transcriptional regulator GlxA family with amidase domain